MKELIQPIIAYEHMNKFYVLEGNKRVSVLKYFKATSIMGEVTRIVPRKTDDKNIKIYYEYMDFYELSHYKEVVIVFFQSLEVLKSFSLL